ncbi:hypothetical protein [Deinococcus yavapaiensis]|uniref:Uncharacterized protein n=1 Tax=Deinococcus yavapaiensis KR-236 TaxID=694435 RepID=A0A318S5A5_9DEIO|nr:hypothetical protein [Deinococcus yavapaiensis]PYE48385.1 hypothetical protein DES52_1294 [Deinococcus yavapaiensis KR-236]
MNGPERVWSDLYGCPRAQWQGATGGHHWLVVCSGDKLGEVAKVLSAARFKGRVDVLVTSDVTPLLAALDDLQPKGTVVVGATLRGGPAVEVSSRQVDLGGVSYHEGGVFPAWTAALTLDAPEGACSLASACTSAGVPVMSSTASDLHRVLHTWWAQTPHSLTYV